MTRGQTEFDDVVIWDFVFWHVNAQTINEMLVKDNKKKDKMDNNMFIFDCQISQFLKAVVFFPPNRAPSPTKRKEDDKSKQRGKDRSGATKDGADKDRGRDKNRTRRSASSGSSRCELVLKR